MSLGVVAPIVALFLLVYSATQSTITVAPGHEITLDGGVTEAEGSAVGESLVQQAFMGPQAHGDRDVMLRKEGKQYVLGFFVKAGSWDEPQTIEAFSCIVGRVRTDALGDQPIQVELLDEWGLVKKNFPAPSRKDSNFAMKCGG